MNPFEDYATAELAALRRIAQDKLTKETRRIRVIQRVYDSAKHSYDVAKSEYQKLDLAYAMKTKVTVCPPKKERATPTRNKKKRSTIPASLLEALKCLPSEKLQEVIDRYERS